MKVNSLLICFLIFSFICKAQKTVSADECKSNICKTWVAYEETIHIPMLKTIENRKLVKKADIDSLIINQDYTVIRFHRGRICNGIWELNSDNSIMVFKFPDCSDYYFSLGKEEFLLTSLKDNKIKMLCDMWKEGEYTERLFRLVK